MKKVMISMLVGMFAVSMASAQMTATEREEFAKWQEFKRMKTDNPTIPEQVGHYAGVGKEIGSALKEAVQALDQGITVTEEHVYKFVNTTAGKVTMGMIVWKVAGKSILSAFIGLTLLGMLVPWVWLWVRFFILGKMVLDKRVVKSWWCADEKTYVRVNASKDLSSESYGFWCGVFAFGAIAFFVGSMICFFGGN